MNFIEWLFNQGEILWLKIAIFYQNLMIAFGVSATLSVTLLVIGNVLRIVTAFFGGEEYGRVIYVVLNLLAIVLAIIAYIVVTNAIAGAAAVNKFVIEIIALLSRPIPGDPVRFVELATAEERQKFSRSLSVTILVFALVSTLSLLVNIENNTIFFLVLLTLLILVGLGAFVMHAKTDLIKPLFTLCAVLSGVLFVYLIFPGTFNSLITPFSSQEKVNEITQKKDQKFIDEILLVRLDRQTDELNQLRILNPPNPTSVANKEAEIKKTKEEINQVSSAIYSSVDTGFLDKPISLNFWSDGLTYKSLLIIIGIIALLWYLKVPVGSIVLIGLAVLILGFIVWLLWCFIYFFAFTVHEKNLNIDNFSQKRMGKQHYRGSIGFQPVLPVMAQSVEVLENGNLCIITVPAHVQMGVKAEDARGNACRVSAGTAFTISATGQVSFGSNHPNVGPCGESGYLDPYVDSPFINNVGGLEFAIDSFANPHYLACDSFSGIVNESGIPVFRIIETTPGYFDGNTGGFTVTLKTD